ncbi:MAG: shikimate dehydrogenase [bacterium]|nr:shikimate dehydrogenase [bacterium]
MGSDVQARVFGVLGDPVDHSLSPAMHNAAFAARGLPHCYLRFRVAPEQLPDALDEARRLGVPGLNLTVPLKETVLPLCDALTAAARRAGAVNTLTLRRGRIAGDNTDGRGFVRALPRGLRLRGSRVVVIGAGGSARAVGAALVDAGCARLTIANRTPSRGAALAERLAALGDATIAAVGLGGLETRAILGDAALVVNTTPGGLTGETVAVRHALTPRSCVFVDLVYGPRPSRWLRAAAKAGRRTQDGAGMLLHQGALAFAGWTGGPAPVAAMALALRSAGLALPGVAASRSVGAHAWR